VVCRPAAAGSVADFYKGKTITLIVGTSAGGTYDTTAHLVARHLGRHLPGEPAVIVQSMLGAGGVNALQHLYAVAPRDGSVIGMAIRYYPLEPLLDPGSARYDPLRFNPIGSTSSEVAVAVTWHSSPVKTFDDLFTTGITVGATGLLDDTSRFPLVARNLTGAKIRIVIGYPGGNDVTLAMEKGEVDGRFGWSWGSVKSRAANWLAEKKINIIFQIGMKKAPDLPDTPFIMDYAKTARDRQALELLFAAQTFAWPFIAPPDIPADRLAALRGGFDATMKDRDFLADAAKLDLAIAPVSGEEMAALIKRILSFDHAVVERAAALTAGK
jgi:tripartite-type tricarboxylate transporter receptor subunit TctC